MSFVHLHLHTEYSLLDGVTKLKPLLQKVSDLGMNACAVTDHGVMYGIYDFWSKAKDYNVKPIIGCEVYVANRKRTDKITGVDNERYHLTLIAKNKTGYHNLIKMVSAAHLEGFYYKPRVDKELLKQYGEGIIALSGCLASNFNRYLAAGKREEAVEWLKFLQECFSDVYVELQRNGVKESHDLIPTQVQIAQELGIPIVATCDVHYLEPEDYKIQEIAWCISDGKKLSDPDRRQYDSQEFYLKSPEQMAELFADMPEAVENTQKIADMVEVFPISFDRVQPRYDTTLDQEMTKANLRQHAFDGAKKRYGVITDEINTRLEYELEVINDKGYNDYFLVVEDYVKWAKSQGILVGPGRGSGAGSVIAYCLEITNLDPFRYDLIFERFLNPQRPSPPDFDIDFQDDRRDELFDYMTKRYGKDHTSFIGTFGRLKAKAAIRDVARVMDIDLRIADTLSKMVIVKFGRVHTIEKMRAEVPEFDQIIKSDPRLEELAKYVSKLDNIARHVSTHACGFLVTPNPIEDYLPVQQESKGGDKVVTQFEGGVMEDLGLMKFDFLGLSNLSIIGNALKQIKYSKGLDIDIDKIPLDDQATFKLFQEGNTAAIFQFESGGMRKYLRELKPTEIEDIIFMAAAYRPGPMQYIHDYIERKFGRQKVIYPDESVSKILEKTYGFAIYQEQVINIAVEFAKYSLGEADLLRRAMGKKKPEVMAKEKEKFLQKSVEAGRTPEKAAEIFSYLEPFADYGFNRSHSAAYALIAYQTGYLKANYPLEFFAGLMQTNINSADKLERDLEEAKNMHIEILPPDVNKSFYSFSIEDGKAIRFGLGGIKGCGEKIMKAIVDERREKGSYANLDDLIERVGTANLGKKELESLIRAGAMDSFGSRNALLAVMPAIFDRVAKSGSIAAIGQIGLFGTVSSAGGTVAATSLPVLEPVTDSQKIQWEKELLGVFLSTHPLSKYFWASIVPEFTNIENLKDLKEGTKVKLVAFIDSAKVIRTKNGNKPMSFLTISDMNDKCEAVLFPENHAKYGEMIKQTAPMLIEGSVSLRNDSCSVLINSITPIDDMQPPKQTTIDIRGITDKDQLEKLRDCFVENGEIEVKVLYGDKQNSKSIIRSIPLQEKCIEGIKPYILREYKPPSKPRNNNFQSWKRS